MLSNARLPSFEQNERLIDCEMYVMKVFTSKKEIMSEKLRVHTLYRVIHHLLTNNLEKILITSLRYKLRHLRKNLKKLKKRIMKKNTDCVKIKVRRV